MAQDLKPRASLLSYEVGVRVSTYPGVLSRTGFRGQVTMVEMYSTYDGLFMIMVA